MTGKFEVFKSNVNYHYYFRLKAGNDQIILSSQGYSSKQVCLVAIASVRNNAQLDDRYDRKNAAMNYSFNLKAGNGEIIGRSQSYTSLGARENGIRSVKHNAIGATVFELD